jgi:hypothetical protein
MKVGDDSTPAAANDDLFERMRRAHRGGEVDEVEHGKADLDAGKADLEATPRPSAADFAPGLQERLLEATELALDGAFQTPRELREAVVEAIVDERYADKLPASEADSIRQTVQASLANAPLFRREVDNMLVLAAEQLRMGDQD